jgi:hypothetical protein
MGAKGFGAETFFWVNWENSNCEERYKKSIFYIVKK